MLFLSLIFPHPKHLPSQPGSCRANPFLMQFTWHGLSCFEIVAKTAQGEITLVTDPYGNETGLRTRALEAQIVTMSHDAEDANNKTVVAGAPFLIDKPGEYEVKGVFVYATSAPIASGEHLLTRIETEGMSVGHLGAIDRELTDQELEAMRGVDVLLIPVGGGRVLDAKRAAAVMQQIEPRIVIPMTYAIPTLKETLGSLEDFYKAVGSCRKEESNKYKIAKKDLPEEELVCVTLMR